ncbi:lytic polysaccharide monooxygenase auxiliary activity family 9 protein [Streptomyces sp. NPDC048845]|uniref:lytic polysaccharide monooxygenase auxiliary activity family 9 protein n=1 Tax=Streptomyces sp. NPDC048845 TaxID=3155390 RepID=UPI00341AA7E7
MRRKTKITSTLVGLGVAGTALFATTGSAQAHGYTDASRQSHCANGTVSDCGNIQWEPQSVEGPKGFPGAGPADGKICSAGNGSFAQLDDPRGGEWPAADVGSGQNYSFTWKITARHSTTDFRYFITKDGYDPSQPLTRADLESEPFLTVPMDGAQPDATVTHEGTLPQKSGKHLILAVWDVADTGNAFYACSDVQF